MNKELISQSRGKDGGINTWMVMEKDKMVNSKTLRRYSKEINLFTFFPQSYFIKLQTFLLIKFLIMDPLNLRRRMRRKR